MKKETLHQKISIPSLDIYIYIKWIFHTTVEKKKKQIATMKINQTDVLRSNCPNHIIFLFSLSFITQFFSTDIKLGSL